MTRDLDTEGPASGQQRIDVGALRHMELCAGYGGIGIALERAFGAETVAVSDIDAGACKILAHRYPHVPNIGDMTTVDWNEWVGKVDIISAGYPCQPFSAAGRRRGTSDERHLWPVIADALAIIRPPLCVFENVRGHLSLGFDEVVRDLHQLGYDVFWYGVKASDVGAAHHRFRLFIFGVDRNERAVRSGSDRRRGLDRDRELGRNVSCPTPGVDDGQGDARTHGDAADVRREGICRSRCDGEDASDTHMGHHGGGCDVHRREAPADALGEGRGCRRGDRLPEDARLVTSKSSTWPHLDGGSEGACSDASETHQGSEPSRTRPGAADAAGCHAGRGVPVGLVVGAERLAHGAGRVLGEAPDDGSHGRGAPLRDANAELVDGSGGRGAVRADADERGREREWWLRAIKRHAHRPGRANGIRGAGEPAPLVAIPTPTAERDGNTPETHLARKPGRKVVTSLDVVVNHCLPSPRTSDTNGPGGPDLRTVVSIMPTPRATDGTKGGPNQRGSSGDVMLPSAVQDWREYEPAIRRQEAAFGYPAPLPTEPNKNGNPRLSAAFSEWLMGLEPGWITDVPGITRNEALKAAGNGVVPQQCEAAARRFLSDYEAAT